MIRYRKLPENILQGIDSLTDFFMNDSNIVFAYLFGGLLKDKHSPLSDIDIAVYINNIRNLDYLVLFDKTTSILATDEVDLVILNRSPISLTGRIMQNRKILIDKNPFLRHRYESVTMRKYFDFAVKERDILEKRYGIG